MKIHQLFLSLTLELHITIFIHLNQELHISTLMLFHGSLSQTNFAAREASGNF